MNPDVFVLAALGVLLVLVLAGFGWVVRDRRRTYAALEAARADAREALAEVAALKVRLTSAEPRVEPVEYVITHLGEGLDTVAGFETGAERPPHQAPFGDGKIDGKLFADLVMRETVVKAAAFGHGVRRAMRPESRNRIRFEMKREVKRSRKARKDEFKQVRREMRDRQRAAVSTP